MLPSRTLGHTHKASGQYDCTPQVVRPSALQSVCAPKAAPNCSPRARLATVHAWTQVIDQASGKPYYWNTDTNETAWEIPTVDDSSSLSTLPHQQLQALGQQQHNHDQQQHLSQQQPQPEAMSQQELFDVLEAAYAADNSGMQFWEVARAHRHHGVFEPPFFEYLEARQAAAGSEEQRELAFKMMCRLSNPLLRQPAPFE